MASWAWPGPWQSSGGVDGWEVERRIMQEKKREATEKARRPSPQTEPLPPNKTKSFPLLEMSSHHSLLRCGLRKWPPKYPKKGGLGQGERLGEVKTCKTGGGGRPTLTTERAHIMTYSRTAGKLKYPSINTRVSSLSFASGLRRTPFMRDTGLWESEEKCKRGSR